MLYQIAYGDTIRCGFDGDWPLSPWTQRQSNVESARFAWPIDCALQRLANLLIVRRLRRVVRLDRFKFRGIGPVLTGQPPAIAPMIRNGASPFATEAGTGVPEGSCVKSSLQA